MKHSYLNRNHILYAIGACLLILTGCKKDLQQEAEMQGNTGPAAFTGINGQYVPNQVLVKFNAGGSPELVSQAMAIIGGTLREKILTKAMQQAGDQAGIQLIRTPMEVPAAMALLKSVAGVVYAEPNFIYHHEDVADDPYFINKSLWGMYGTSTSPANTYGSQAAAAWAAGKTGSSSVFVGVIDEGAMYNHEDLAGNIWTNTFESVDNVDNDNNGYVDDIHGWDFAGNNNSTFDGTADDHGTHVSGTIGAKGKNGKGVVGVNWSVSIISAKFLGSNGGTSANAVKALDYLTDMKKRHSLNLVATNNSWGGGGFSQSLKDAIDRSNTANILFIAAAGNDGSNNDATTSYPSGYASPNIISVAAITSTGGLASFSNYGATTVDLGAPGSGIYSTVPLRKNASGYSSYSGTSMATPHVTGAAALYASVHPGATASQIKSAILSTATSTSSLTGKCVTGGRLNVAALVGVASN